MKLIIHVAFCTSKTVACKKKIKKQGTREMKKRYNVAGGGKKKMTMARIKNVDNFEQVYILYNAACHGFIL